jgi:hypothetical protein
MTHSKRSVPVAYPAASNLKLISEAGLLRAVWLRGVLHAEAAPKSPC